MAVFNVAYRSCSLAQPTSLIVSASTAPLVLFAPATAAVVYLLDNACLSGPLPKLFFSLKHLSFLCLLNFLLSHLKQIKWIRETDSWNHVAFLWITYLHS